MKKLFFLTFLFFVHFISYSQKQIEGIGRYKIGNTINQILTAYEARDVIFKDKDPQIVEADINDDSTINNEIVTFQLYFFNDTLYKIYISGILLPPVLLEMFKLKFGKGQTHKHDTRSKVKDNRLLLSDETTNWVTLSTKATYQKFISYQPWPRIDDEEFTIIDIPINHRAEQYIKESEDSVQNKNRKDLYNKL